MKKLIKPLSWILFVIYAEIILAITIFNNLNSLVYVILFSVLIGVILHLLTSFKNKKINVLLTYLFLIFITIISIAQIIYNSIYESIYSIYSATNAAGQIWQFSDRILEGALSNLGNIVLMVIPIVITIVLHLMKKIKFKGIGLKQRLIELAFGLIVQIVAIVIICVSPSEDVYSDRNLYFKTNGALITANRFGVFTTMRLDLQRTFFKTEDNVTLVISEQEFNEEEPGGEDNVVEYNVIEVDWDSLIENESNNTVKSIYEYVKSQEPSKKNEYTGMFEGKNLVVFVAEAFTDLAVDEEVTPTLYKLYSEGFQFDNFYTPLFPVSTADGEYITDTSLIPKEGVWSLSALEKNYMPYSYANIFKAKGYSTQAYHDHSAKYYNRDKYIKAMGYDSYLARGTGLEKRMNLSRWPSSDVDMIDVTTQDYLGEGKGQFIAYYMTVSGHLNYTTVGNNIVNKNWSLVKDLEYSEKAKGYLAAQIELDRAVELLIQRLEEAGELENTVILISGDHYPYGLTLDEINELSDTVRDDNFEKHRSIALLWSASMEEPVKVEKIASSLDLVPTVLNLFGVEFDSRLLMGRDILSDSESMVIYANRSFITQYGRYSAITGEFEPVENLPEEFNIEEYVKNMKNSIYNKYQVSKWILENDFYRKMWKSLGLLE